ncbi:probable JmjC domain-containing histone demethylation protein 2C isoform X2 [Bombyx mori]|uniref:[histone H3]-dimethyl-L-lysine(9) demethylase n=1 Tax=Bombyx mori TaxID=7091 RepID=A0A8R2M8Y4_BOMMO|nr:lysine-specific demethylase 3B isoform X3 [Bombyx mori]
MAVRCNSARNYGNTFNMNIMVLVEYDGVEWQRREWVAVYSRRTFRVFLVERTLVWAPRTVEGKEVQWPALTFTQLAADLTIEADAQPVEYLHDKQLQFMDYANLLPYQKWDAHLAGSESGVESVTLSALSAEASEWRTSQDGQRILTTTPSVLGGCRAQVYRAAGATQWYTAVIVGVNEHTGELTVTDDTVLEEHSEDPSLVQMRLLGDGVIESIMRGEVVGVMPRRSRSNLQRVERETTKSPATTGNRKKTGTVRSNGQIAQVEPTPPPPTGSSPERDPAEISQKGPENCVSESDVVNVSEETKCVKKQEEVSKSEVCAKSDSEVKSAVSCGVGADGVASAVASEEDDCVIVCARDADDRSDSGVSGVRSGGSASSVEEREWRGMAHGYGGGPPPPLLHLPAPPPPSLYAPELLWKQRYQTPLHPPLHHAITDEYLAYDRERHERLLRERREQEQQMLEKQQKERKERERIEQEREREREREKQEREDKERREQENAASKLVSRHFEESLRLANQKRGERNNLTWSIMHSLTPNRAAPAPEHDRLRVPTSERNYYSPPGHPPTHPTHPQHTSTRPPVSSPGDYCSPHARLVSSKAQDKNSSHPGLPKGEPNFAPYNYPPYRAYEKIKDPHLPAPPPLVSEKNTVIVKHDAKQIHLEQNHQYPSKPRNDPSPHYLPSRTYRTGPSPHAPPHQTLQPAPHTAALPAQDKSGRRLYQPQPKPQLQRSPAYYAAAPPVKPKVSSPAPPHIYGKPSNSQVSTHYAVAVEPPPPPIAKAEPPPVPYPPPSTFSPVPRTWPPPPAHSRTPEPRPTPRHVVDSTSTSPCQTQPLDLGVPRDDSDRLSPRRRAALGSPSPSESDAKRRRLEESTAPQPLIAAAASVARASAGSEPAPLAPGPPCDVRVPSADGSIETPERAAGASPAPRHALAASPAPATPVSPLVASPLQAAAPPPAPTPPAPPATPPVSVSGDADTPAKAASSPRDGSAPVRHLGKKAWLQRHETAPIGEGDCSGGGGTCITLPMTITRNSEQDDSGSNVTVPVAAKSIQRSVRKTSKPRKTKEPNGRVDDVEEDSSSSDRESSAPPKRKPPKAKRKKSSVARKIGDEPKRKKAAAESGSESDKESDDKDTDSGGSGSGSGSTSSRRGAGRARGRRSRGGGRGGRRREEPPRRNVGNTPVKPPQDSFLQSGPCFEVAPRLAKCRECRWSPAQRDKDMPNIFCRFYAFRRLKYAKNRQLAIAGFSDPYKDAEEEDKKLWLSSSAGAAELDIEMSCFLLREIGDQFCELLQQEKEAESHHLNTDKTVAWKRVVQGVREMCDVCETTLFNFHWTCGKCGFVVCLDCYKTRTTTEATTNSSSETSSTSNVTTNGERDSFGWLTCTMGGPHPARRLLLTQIAAGGALGAAATRVHTLRSVFGLPACSCGHAPAPSPQRRQQAKNLLQIALNKNVKKEDVKEESTPTNGSSPVKSENVKTGSSIVSWLSDLPIKSESKDEKSDSSTSDSDEGGNYSTLRELLIRPAPEGGEVQPKKKQKKNKSDALEDVISSIVDEKKDEDEDEKPFVLSNVVKRYDRSGRSREELPVRIMTLTESKLLYPDVPHAWLCDGKLLHLTDAVHAGNYKPFQDQWKRGQPVLVSDVSALLDKDLWSPESFSRDFGDTRVDLVNCASGLVVPNQPARKFWDGFDLAVKRLRDERGAPMVLKLKDWPPGEDFAELLPARFDDLMRALPLSEYTSRNGKLNLAARLPECFVRPDLGPKMYTAYGGAGGTTNLHLDVSDAVNVMVHASAPADAPERAREAARAAEEAGVDVLSRRRARLKPPAALWHIYAAKDADKIRDFLVRAELDRGARPRPQHDPVHDQTWYLDAALRERLYREYGVEGYAILQCPGDAVFVPAGAPHQVRNLLDCIKVAEDFVSPENVSRCFELAQQFRQLSRQHSNKEDKLQIKNIVYHAVKDSLCCLEEALAKAE